MQKSSGFYKIYKKNIKKHYCKLLKPALYKALGALTT